MLKMENGINSDARTLLRIREEKMRVRQILKDLNEDEKLCIKNIQSYLNENDERGIKIDDIVIELNTRTRKIAMTKNEYVQYLQELFIKSDNFQNVDMLIQQVLSKTSDTVQEQKLNIVKKK